MQPPQPTGSLGPVLPSRTRPPPSTRRHRHQTEPLDVVATGPVAPTQDDAIALTPGPANAPATSHLALITFVVDLWAYLDEVEALCAGGLCRQCCAMGTTNHQSRLFIDFATFESMEKEGHPPWEGYVFIMPPLCNDGSMDVQVTLFIRAMDIFKDCRYSLEARDTQL
ncbi:hypothetical protein PR202_ga22434 [Eleusine coracana subsp. coracana]|uniref:Uncharacterized protein n=1 Tax=Eleusine coracana subsp. coracana TaxID=191504 RepID=A0AAV5D3L5_ELECO|nr:hypothetical protein PR202_ga22434 [Eleusine coracana subsp. coracana]